jgi:hypothetical protein
MPLIGWISLTLHPSPPRVLDRYLTIVCEVLVCVVQKYAVLLQEPMDLHAGFEAEQFADIRFREAVAAVPLQSYSFKGRSRRVLSCSDQLTGKFFRNLNGDGHGILLV